jgi:hypothetical protein
VAVVPSGPNWTPPPTIPIKKKLEDTKSDTLLAYIRIQCNIIELKYVLIQY